jgi:hypothetical protein
MTTFRFLLPFLAVTAAVLPSIGCADTDDSTHGPAEDEVKAKSARTMEGELQADPESPTGFQISEKIGREDHEVVAVDFSKAKLPGALLAGKTLRITGKSEMRKVGSLPNGTSILNEVLVADQVVERTKDRADRTGKLVRGAGGLQLLVPGDPISIELPANASASLIGKTVRAKGTLAHDITGAIADKHLIFHELLVADSITPSGS